MELRTNYNRIIGYFLIFIHLHSSHLFTYEFTFTYHVKRLIIESRSYPHCGDANERMLLVKDDNMKVNITVPVTS